MDTPVVAVVGRPNVGKSTFVNRAVGKRVVIVEDRPGVTRDRKTVEAEWLGIPFLLVDTGGWLPSGNDLDQKVSRQVEQAVRGADLIVFLVDASVGITEEDDAVATWLRRAGKPVLLGVNKADNNQREDDRWQFLALGLGEPYPISALHGRRTGDFLDEVIARLPSANGDRADGASETDDEAADAGGADRADGAVGEQATAVPAVAIVGRPNVGKSTLFNRLIGDDRSVVHDRPGTTRDAIDTVVDTPDGPIRYVDTAGMRRKSRIDDPTEYYSLVRALRAVDESDIALLVIDATEGVTAQDQRLAERIDAAGCPVVVLLNKWELLDDPDDRADVLGQMARKLHFIGDAPVLQVSALTGKGVHKLRPVLADAIERYHRRVPTREVNAVIGAAQQAQPAPGGARVLYALQGASDPPTFTLFVNRELPSTYLRYLERKLRERFDLGSVPIKLRVRKRSS
ncbi:MAG TPA: ribosome biogenesis GTPase Der [Acidimicrobiales bacterium]